MIDDTIIHNNKTYWNNHADFWFGTTALPQYGVKFPTEDELKLFGDVTGKKMLEICCGSGHSIKYHAERGAGELWGIDISQNQLDNAKKYLEEYGCAANLIYSSMEEMNLPQDYFDYVYSIYGIGWTTDLQGTFNKIASSLPDGEYSATSSRQVGCTPLAPSERPFPVDLSFANRIKCCSPPASLNANKLNLTRSEKESVRRMLL